MRVLVCGGRDYNDVRRVHEELGTLHPSRVIHGGANGADRLAGRWAHQNGIPCEVHEAEWLIYGRGAGPKRNARMLEVSKPDVVLAFPGGKGTDDMVKRAERAGVRVIRVADRYTCD